MNVCGFISCAVFISSLYPDELQIVCHFVEEAVEDRLLWLRKKQLILLLSRYMCHLLNCVFLSPDCISYSRNASHHVLSV